MPQGKERKKAYMRDYQRAQRGTNKEGLTAEGTNKDLWPGILEKVAQQAQGFLIEFSPSELQTVLQWGIDTNRIRAREDVATEYDLTQPEPVYGPAKLTKTELLSLLNNDIKLKKIDAPLYFLGAGEPSNHSGVRYSYSKDWYK